VLSENTARWMTAREEGKRETKENAIQGSCSFVKIKFKDFQGPYEGYIRKTKLKQTSTFISLSRQSCPLKFSAVSSPSGVRAEPRPLTHFCGIRAQETHLVIAITCSVTAF